MIRSSLVRRVAAKSPLVLGTYAAATVIGGYGFTDPALDVIGLASTATAYLATDSAIARLRRHSERELNS